ncbi:abortive infection family protein [Dyadobacter bucti]|uniref:abortive infection family protein n=1 Tax=Dyadobacter bucti TaxID=2572203 RepID=UPI00140C77C3|nr:abortive infection family protein [Dyadobacter bucti]
MDIISLRTQSEFQEFLVGYTLREIARLFDNCDLSPREIPSEELPNGERRSLVAKYYANVDGTNLKDVRKVTEAYAEILEGTSETLESDPLPNDLLKRSYNKLIKNLERDGFVYADGKITRTANSKVDLAHDAVDLCDADQFREYVDRINASIDVDPALAIGSTKELIESVLKTILTKMSVDFEKDDDVPKLLKKVQKSLKLAPDDIDNAAKGAEIIKVLLSNLGSVVIKLAELRNLYGTGHGVGKVRKGMEPRHAKLAVGAGISLCTFLLDTFKHRSDK